ncbi:MAG: hypothetical protein CL506_04575 [Actinobacteria bacterium]|jgi:hypothetical protein|nr:hypothetical protein [Actinomycetota bacterium]
MSSINSKRLKTFLQEAKDTLLEAEMLSYTINNRVVKRVLSEKIIPNFINYLTYLEIEELNNKEIKFYLKKSISEFSQIAEFNNKTMQLNSKFRRLQEETNKIIIVQK